MTGGKSKTFVFQSERSVSELLPPFSSNFIYFLGCVLQLTQNRTLRRGIIFPNEVLNNWQENDFAPFCCNKATIKSCGRASLDHLKCVNLVRIAQKPDKNIAEKDKLITGIYLHHKLNQANFNMVSWKKVVSIQFQTVMANDYFALTFKFANALSCNWFLKKCVSILMTWRQLTVLSKIRDSSLRPIGVSSFCNDKQKNNNTSETNVWTRF